MAPNCASTPAAQRDSARLECRQRNPVFAVRRQLLNLKKRNEDCLVATSGEWWCAIGIGKEVNDDCLCRRLRLR